MMFCHNQKPYSWLLAMSVVLVVLIVSGCGTTMYMNRKYAGYKVLNKESKVETKKVPIRVTSCVTPQNNVVCERRYGAFTECSFACKVPPNKWVERPKGYGGYEDKVFTDYYMVLESPDGKAEQIEVTEPQYSEFQIGQILGKPQQ